VDPHIPSHRPQGLTDGETDASRGSGDEYGWSQSNGELHGDEFMEGRCTKASGEEAARGLIVRNPSRMLTCQPTPVDAQTVWPGSTSSTLRKNSICVLRQAQHERNTPVYSMPAPFVLRLSKDERRVFPQPARQVELRTLHSAAVSYLIRNTRLS
jgi:hypothetical protein